MRKIAVTPILLTLATAVLLSGCDSLRARMELNKGNTYYKNEQYKDALSQFQKGLALDPDLTFAWRSVALSAMVLGAFLLAGTVKGCIGLGLPTVAIGLLSLAMPAPQAAALRDVLTAFRAEGLPRPEEMQAAVKRDLDRLMTGFKKMAALQMSAPETMRGRVASLLPVFPAFISVGALTHTARAVDIGLDIGICYCRPAPLPSRRRCRG